MAPRLMRRGTSNFDRGPHSHRQGQGTLDLVVDPPYGSVIEFKFPRDSKTGMSPDTMMMGGLVRDFLRVAVVPSNDRWVVEVLNTRLIKYLERLQERSAINAAAVTHSVTATCVFARAVGDDLRLFAYRV